MKTAEKLRVEFKEEIGMSNWDFTILNKYSEWLEDKLAKQPAVSSKTELRQCKSCGYVTNEPKAPQPAVSEGEIIHTLCNDSGEGTIIKTPQADAQQRYEKAIEAAGMYLLEHMEEDIDYALFARHVAKIAAGLPPQEKGGEG